MKKIFTAFLFIILYSQILPQTTGKLSGKITDETGEVLIGANVVVVSTKQGAATDIEGYYSILNLRAGVYTVRVSYTGYQSQVIENVRIASDQTKTLDVVLAVQSIEGDEVVIVAKRPIVEFNQTSSVSNINKDEIQNLPVQNLNDIVNLQAGVVDGHFRGGRLGEVQYQLDGVTVNNPFNNTSTMEVDRSIIEEVQVISGTFDAKYGQAMSGVVNAVLRTGSDHFEISGEVFGGDYFTTDTKRYPHNRNFSPIGIYNYQLTVSGPTGIDKTTFFLSGRGYRNSGYLFGERRFSPFDKNDFEQNIFYPTGDKKIVSMNDNDEYNGQFKITNQSIDGLQVFYQATYNWSKRKVYNHALRLNPEGSSPKTTTSLTHGLGITHTIADNLFYKLNFRQNYFDYKDMYYDNLYDPYYLAAGEFKSSANYEDGAIVQGVDLTRYKQLTNGYIVKGDLTWQFNRTNLFEAGGEFQISEIEFGSPGFFVSTSINGVQTLIPREEWPRIPGVEKYYPKQFAAYVQDRIEFGDIVLRGGVRFEMFDANSWIPSDLSNPANTITGAPISVPQKTKIKSEIAPRIGLSFPLTAVSSVYFSYGHFYQLPGLGLLYGNANYGLLDQLQAGGISYGVMGNPDLKPEKTVQYEFGLKQAIGDIFGAELTFFYKDIRDLLGTEFVSTYTAAEYARFTNIDFGGVYGFTIALSQRNWSNFSTSLDYTLQYAQGNSSDPRESSNRASSGKDPRPRNIAFGWDQRHTLNATVVYFIPDDYSISTIIRFGSGQPYTPEIGSGFNAELETNTGRKNSYALVDLRAEKYFGFGSLNFSLFLRVFNLFNTNSVNGFVFNSTGSPDYTLTPAASPSALYDPSRFYEPRRIEFGISFRTK
ncbi:MAG TPA: TonB-dependent receptor [Ignavibacteriaceae bacterium]|nr:TonB-dependent receptor [Ignavibacteriaceae bacterium]